MYLLWLSVVLIYVPLTFLVELLSSLVLMYVGHENVLLQFKLTIHLKMLVKQKPA